MIRLKRKGQSTVEYLVLVGGVIAIIIAVLRPTGLFGSRLRESINASSEGMVSMTERVIDSMN